MWYSYLQEKKSELRIFILAREWIILFLITSYTTKIKIKWTSESIVFQRGKMSIHMFKSINVNLLLSRLLETSEKRQISFFLFSGRNGLS